MKKSGRKYYHVFGREKKEGAKWFHQFSADTKEDAAYEADYIKRTSEEKMETKVILSEKDVMELLEELNSK